MGNGNIEKLQRNSGLEMAGRNFYESKFAACGSKEIRNFVSMGKDSKERCGKFRVLESSTFFYLIAANFSVNVEINVLRVSEKLNSN